jgi:outer membrane lipoprotein
MKLALLIPVALLAAGCASAPKPLQGDYAAVLPEQASATLQEGAAVRWGGSIVSVTPGPAGTCMEILGRELSEIARPRARPDESAGRFLACRAGFYDPAIFAPEREITVTGRIDGFEVRRIGEYDYRYPRVAADVIYLWPERRDETWYYHPAPFFPIHRSTWWGGYYVPLRPARPRAVEAPPAPSKP